MEWDGGFDSQADLYDAWFEQNREIFLSELTAIEQLLPRCGTAVEIGVGTGRFAEALDVRDGVEPSPAMRSRAEARGVRVWDGVAEALPLGDASYDCALMITVECFLSDVPLALREVWRILAIDGCLIVAFIDRDTPLGKIYDQKRPRSDFYRQAKFHSAAEIGCYLTEAGFQMVEARQTIFSLENCLQEVRCGVGEGVFAVVKANKPSSK